MERFYREFIDERRRQEKEHEELLDFTGFDFPDEITFQKKLPMVSFSDVTFRKTVRFLKSINGSFVFKGTAGFEGATFEGAAEFGEATFEGLAMFDLTTFKSYAGFSRVTFTGGAAFGGATFEKNAGFNLATFEGLAMFDLTTFKGPTGFSSVTFKGETYFIELSISAGISFDFIEIEKKFALNISRWENPSEITIYTLDIRSPIFGENGKLVITRKLGTTQDFIAGISLLDTEMDKIEFIEEIWPRWNNRKIIIDEVFLTREIEDKIEPPHTLSPERVAQVYRRLRKNYEQSRRYPEAGDFLIGEMEVTRKFKQNTDGTNVKRSFGDPTWILHSLYFVLGKYGESISRPLIWFLAIWIMVSEFHTIQVYNIQEYSHFVWCFLESSYITLSAMFPITSVNEPFDFFLKLIGSLLIGLTYIALRRRLERK